jgi:hypothetical protein
LEEFCKRENLSLPIYQLHKTKGHDQNGNEIDLFLYKITLPGYLDSIPLSSNNLLRNSEDAKNEASQYLLKQLTANYIQKTLNKSYSSSMTSTNHLLNDQQQQQQQSISNLKINSLY